MTLEKKGMPRPRQFKRCDKFLSGPNTLCQEPTARLKLRRSGGPELCVDVGIFKRRYGSIPPEANPRSLSVTELEYEAALSTQRPIKIFISSDEKGRDHALTEFLENELSNASTGHWRKTFHSIDELKFQVTATIAIEIINYYHIANSKALELLDGLDNLLMSPDFTTEYADIGYRNVDSIAFKVVGRKEGCGRCVEGDLRNAPQPRIK